MFRNLLIAMMFSLFATISVADEIAYTTSGKKVLLKDDGTWSYVKESSEDKNKFDFRKTTWGMSKEQVKLSEDIKPVAEEKDLLMYETEVLHMKCYIAYKFVGNILATVIYKFIDRHSNENDYISDYSNVKVALNKKYGTPEFDDINWKNDLFADEPSRYGFAVSLGHLVYQSKWETDSTDIILSLDGENYEIDHAALYYSKIFYPKMKEKNERESKSDF